MIILISIVGVKINNIVLLIKNNLLFKIKVLFMELIIAHKIIKLFNIIKKN